MASQLILGLIILVGVHEAGHFLTAKFFGMRVEKFSIGFPPDIFKFKKGETVFSLGAIPLGGFVKISGMVDESLDMEKMKLPPQPWEFRSKPAWQRLIVMMGGIIVNIIVGILIFIVLTFVNGETYLPMSEINKTGIITSPLAREMGLQDGDKLVAVNGKPIQRFSDHINALLQSGSTFTIERNGEKIVLQVPDNMINKLSERKEDAFIDFPLPFKVGEVLPNMPAAKAGLSKGDYILAIDSMPTPYFHLLRSALKAKADKEVQLKVLREEDTLWLKSTVTKDGTLGFQSEPQLTLAESKFSLLESIGIGTGKAFSVITTQLAAFSKIFSGDLAPQHSVGSFLSIAQAYGPQWGQRFWIMTASLSMMLAFMNFLPIPALDGGHVMFLSYEMITGKKPSDRFLEIAQKIGILLLLMLMIFAITNDVLRNL